MNGYELVFQRYFNFSDPQNTEAVRNTDMVPEFIGLTELEIGQQLTFIADRMRQAEGEPDRQQLHTIVQESTLGLSGLELFAKSQIKPAYVKNRYHVYIVNHARRLSDARFLYELATGDDPFEVEPVGTAVPYPGYEMKNKIYKVSADLQTYLKRSGDDITEATGIVKKSGLEGLDICRIALSELEPSTVAQQVSVGKIEDFKLDCRLLTAARNICHDMFRLQNTVEQ